MIFQWNIAMLYYLFFALNITSRTFCDEPSNIITVQVEERGADFFSNLVFKEVSAHHSGMYTCVASNSAAKVNYTAELVVKGTPEIGLICTSTKAPSFIACSKHFTALSQHQVYFNSIFLVGAKLLLSNKAPPL